MFPSERNIIVALFPLLIFLRLNALLLFWVKKVKNNSKIKYFQKSNIFIVVYQILFMSYGIKDMLQFLEMAFRGTTMDLVYCLVFYMDIGSLVLVNFFWETLQNGKFLHLLQKFYALDKFMRKNNMYLDYKKLRNYSILVMIVEATCYIFFHFLTIKSFWAMGYTYVQLGFLFVYYFGVHMMQVSMTAKTYTLFAIIENMFYQINKKLTSDTTVDVISTSRTIYYNVHELVLELNRVLAAQLIVSFSVNFVMLVFHIYYETIVTNFADMMMLIWSAAVLVKILLIIVQIEKTAFSVRRFLN